MAMGIVNDSTGCQVHSKFEVFFSIEYLQNLYRGLIVFSSQKGGQVEFNHFLYAGASD